MLFHDLLAAHRLRGAQVLSVAHRQKALGASRSPWATLANAPCSRSTSQQASAGSGIHRAAGEHAHRQHRAVDDQNAARFALKELQKAPPQCFAPSDKGDVRVLRADKASSAPARKRRETIKSRSTPSPAQLRAHPRQDRGRTKRACSISGVFSSVQSDVVRHEKHGDLLRSIG